MRILHYLYVHFILSTITLLGVVAWNLIESKGPKNHGRKNIKVILKTSAIVLLLGPFFVAGLFMSDRF